MTTADDLLAGIDLPDLIEVTPDPSAGPCWVDLTGYADGTYEPPQPEIGGRRPDGRALLYRGKFHLAVGETGIGKSWFGCHHVAVELMAGSTVVYAHFEEPNPAATVSRLRRLGVPAEVIVSRLKWLDIDRAADYKAALDDLDQPPTLVILDGVVAACGGRSINDDETVNWFRLTFANPATRLGAAVLALHHPVKDPGRRGERGGRGSGSWINLVDGVHFQLMPGGTWISKGRKGWLDIHADKDREGSVVDGASDGPHAGWRAIARLEVEDSDDGVTARLLEPVAAPAGGGSDGGKARITELAEAIVFILENSGGRYEKNDFLKDSLKAKGITFRAADLGAALQWLEDEGRLVRGPHENGKPRPGWLPDAIEGNPGSGSRSKGTAPLEGSS